jgi:hypothetical protein
MVTVRYSASLKLDANQRIKVGGGAARAATM